MVKKYKFSDVNRGVLFDKTDLEAIKRELSKGSSLNLDSKNSTIKKFENNFAKLVGKKFAISMSSCTAALRVACQTLNVKKGDEIIICKHSFWNTIVPFLEFGAKFHFVDTKKNSLSIDENQIKKYISKKTKAVIIWSHGGAPCRADKIYNICKKFKVPLIDDCAHSLGSYLNKKHVGYFSDISCYSFSTQKNIVTLGEGGMLVTNNLNFAMKARGLKLCFPYGEFSFSKEDKKKKQKDYEKLFFLRPPKNVFKGYFKNIENVGTNYKLTSVQAAVGINQLKKLKKYISQRRKIAKVYNDFIKKHKLFFENFIEEKKTYNSYHLFNFMVKKNNFFSRDEFAFELKKRGLEIRNRFWPLNHHPALKYKTIRNVKTTNYEDIWFKNFFSLPISASMTKTDAINVTRILSSTLNYFCK